jgi:DNA-binding transcriptional MerR regulator
VTDIRKALRQLEEMEKESAERHERFKRESAERGAEIDRKLEKLKKLSDSGERWLRVNKRTHRVRFINETEDEVTIVIEKKGIKK